MTKQLQLIGYNFNHAAASYTQNSAIQARAAQKLIAAIPANYATGRILDLGSGPGTFIHSPQVLLPYPLVLYDLSLKMLHNRRSDLAVNGDAHQLPFAAESFSLIISNLMLQWPENKLQVLQEIQRVLTPGGKLIFTSLVQPSLWQLQQAWNQLDHWQHTLDFSTTISYLEACQQAALQVTWYQSWEETCFFNDINQLLRHFKLTGTSLPKANGSGLGGRKRLQQLGESYQAQRVAKGLPLSYHYLILIASKEKYAA